MKSQVSLSDVAIYRNTKCLLNRGNEHGIPYQKVGTLASNREEPWDSLDAGDLLFKAFLFLIHPDKDKGPINLGHALRPEYQTQSNGGFSGVGEVLAKNGLIGQTHI